MRSHVILTLLKIVRYVHRYLGGDLSCTIFSNGSKIEQIRISTSCSVPLVVGDVFGSLTVVGYNDLSSVCNPTCYACPSDSAALGGVGLKTISFEYTGDDIIQHSLPAGSVVVDGNPIGQNPVTITVVTGTPEQIIAVHTGVTIGQSVDVSVADTSGTVTFFISNPTVPTTPSPTLPTTSTATATTVTPAMCLGLVDASTSGSLSCSTRAVDFPDSCALSFVRHHCPQSCCTYGYVTDYSEVNTHGALLAVAHLDVSCGANQLSLGDTFGSMRISSYTHTDESTGSFSTAQGCTLGSRAPTPAPTPAVTSMPTSAPSSSCFDVQDCSFAVQAGACDPGNNAYTFAQAYCARSCGFCLTFEDQLVADINGTVVSASTCDQLEAAADTSVWKTMAATTSALVCGTSTDTAGVCFGEYTFGSEIRQCLDIGARSCTVQEIQQGEVATTLCGASGKFTWSSTACSDQGINGLYLYNYATEDMVCATPGSSSTGIVQCCADHPAPTTTAAGNVANNNNSQGALGSSGQQGLTIAAFILIICLIAVLALVALLKKRQKRDDADVNTMDSSTHAASSVSSRDNSRRYPTLDGVDDDSFSMGTTALDRSEQPYYDRAGRGGAAAGGPAPWEWMDMLKDGDEGAGGPESGDWSDFGPAYSSLDVRTTSFGSIASHDDINEEPPMEEVTYDLASKAATAKQGINLKSWDLYSKATAGGGARDTEAVYAMASPPDGAAGDHDGLEWDGAI